MPAVHQGHMAKAMLSKLVEWKLAVDINVIFDHSVPDT